MRYKLGMEGFGSLTLEVLGVTVIIFFSWRDCVMAVQYILFNFANYSPSIAMELKNKQRNFM